MSLVPIPLSLKIPKPPITPELYSRTALARQESGDAELSRIIWAENVIGTEDGICSLVYNNYITATSGNTTSATSVTRLTLIFAENGASTYYYRSSGGNHMVFRSGAWVSLGTQGSGSYIVFVRGKSYLYAVGAGVYKFTSGFAALEAVELIGIEAITMKGFTSAMDYAIAWDDDFIYWSAPGIPGQYTPVIDNVLTGAGSTKIVELVGKILFCMRINGGFIVYGNLNIISARYSGNSRNPWVFKGLESSAGITRLDAVWASDSANQHFVWTTEGLKSVTLANCTDVFPEVSKFLFGYNYWNSNGDGTFTKVNSANGGTSAPLNVKAGFIADRYFCISFGAYQDSVFKYCLVYDINLQQWGLAKIEHTDVFEFVDVLGYGSNIFPAKGIGGVGFLLSNGNLKVAKQVGNSPISDTDTTTEGEVLFKEIRAISGRAQGISKLSIIGYKASGMIARVASLGVAGTYETEKTFVAQTSLLSWFGTSEGLAAAVRLKGKFNLSSVVADVVIRGGRN